MRALEALFACCAAVTIGACDHPEGPPPDGGATAPPAVSAGAPTRAVIRVDKAHDAMTVNDAPPFVIAPSAGLAIEIGEHRFGQRDAGPVAPDAVHVMHGSSGYYRATFSGDRVVLDVASLDAVKGGAFPGFEAGESYLVAVGAEVTAADGAMRFTPFWTAKVNVASR